MKIALYGFMGSGKSVLGKMLAQALNYKFVDLDKEIESNTNKNISDIFLSKGEIAFRDIEHNMLKEIVKRDEQNIILALGGGTIIRPTNRELLKVKNYKKVYLDVEITQLIRRLKKDKSKRPLLNNIDIKDFDNYIKALFLARETIYKNQADIHIKINNEDIEEAFKKIYLYLNLN